MPEMKNLDVKSLQLDLHNFRTVPQEHESGATNALITIDPDGYWALMDSLLADGYLPNENIIIFENSEEFIVREGNRRISALKIILGYLRSDDFEINEAYWEKINEKSKAWKKRNQEVPCTIYQESESDMVDKIVGRIHGKGEKAGRRKWTSVARARYQRDEKGKSELGLDLLEKYLDKGKNLTDTEAECWSGDYGLTVLDEAMRLTWKPLGYSSSKELSQIYPKKHKRLLDKIMHDIGVKIITFPVLRKTKAKFFNDYGIPLEEASSSDNKSTQTTNATNSTSSKAEQSSVTSSAKPIATASNDPRTVKKMLKEFKPKGENRMKLVTLLREMNKLTLKNHPHSFCFLLRSMFEISAKAYCEDHKSSGGPSPLKKNGKNKTLASLLGDITNHITNDKSDKEKVKELHGAMTELGKSDGLLSVTSLNQLVHNPSFSIQPSDISILFGNVFPLLEEMNK